MLFSAKTHILQKVTSENANQTTGTFFRTISSRYVFLCNVLDEAWVQEMQMWGDGAIGTAREYEHQPLALVLVSLTCMCPFIKQLNALTKSLEL